MPHDSHPVEKIRSAMLPVESLARFERDEHMARSGTIRCTHPRHHGMDSSQVRLAVRTPVDPLALKVHSVG